MSVSWPNLFGSSYGASTGLSSMYSLIGDSKLIKSGTYRKLMTSYFSTMNVTGSSTSSKTSSDSSSSSSSSTSTNKNTSRHACIYTYDSNANTISTIRNKVLDDLLDKTPKTSSVTNSVLDKLIGNNQEGETTTTTPDGTVTEKPITSTTDTTTDTDTATSTTNTNVSEATAGTQLDEAV